MVEPRKVQVRYLEKFFLRKIGEVLKLAAQGSGGIAGPGDI